MTKRKKLCKSEQWKLDAVFDTLSVMHMPVGDLIEGYGCSNDKQLWWKWDTNAQRKKLSGLCK